jgi:tetratricopeptide (TPR) repeat protein
MSLNAIRKLRDAGDHEKACELAIAELENHSGDPELHLETACIHDYLGREADAIPHYRSCIAAGLPPSQLRKAYLGLGSSYRVLGRYEDSELALREALEKFPHANELKVFLAMTLHNLGKFKESTELLLRVVASTANDKTIRRYKKAIMFYAEDVERVWDESD